MPRPVVPTVALVGRTNVGKSTLFNRLVESRRALVSDVAHTTRDRKISECLWRGTVINIVDTGGLDVAFDEEIERDIAKQAEMAIAQADVILFVVDLKAGPLPGDLMLALKLRKSGKPVIVVGNKSEKMSTATSAQNREWRLAGLPAPLPVSAIRGNGVGDLLDEVYEALKKIGKPPAELSTIEAIRVAVIGKPNVGKSSLLNSILGEERFITSAVAHTTREPNDVLIEYGDKSYVLVDTAGMRKQMKVRRAGGLEKAGVERTQQTLRHTDVALFVIDATEPVGSQERTLAGLLQEARVGVIIVINKWDLVADKTSATMNQYHDSIVAAIPFLSWAPLVFVSAKTKQRVLDLFGVIDHVQSNRYRTVPDEELEPFLRSAVRKHLPSKGKGPKPPTILGLKQAGVTPPTFVVTVKAKRLDVLHPSYLRFLENRLRERYDFTGTPTVLNVRGIISV